MSSNKKNTVSKEYKDSIRVVNMSSYQVPTIKEVHNKEWVAFGDDNDYFVNHLLLVLRTSPDHVS